MLTSEIIWQSPQSERHTTESIMIHIEDTAREYGLDIAQRTTLSSYKGSVHYHLKLGSQRGVLEVTYWPDKRRLWLDIHDNRRADWNVRLLELFAKSLADRLQA